MTKKKIIEELKNIGLHQLKKIATLELLNGEKKSEGKKESNLEDFLKTKKESLQKIHEAQVSLLDCKRELANASDNETSEAAQKKRKELILQIEKRESEICEAKELLNNERKNLLNDFSKLEKEIKKPSQGKGEKATKEEIRLEGELYELGNYFFNEEKIGWFINNPRIQVAQHFTLEANIVISDNELGSIGLVYIHSKEKRTKQKKKEKGQQKVDEFIRKNIDRATYLRHLLVDSAEEQRVLPRSVEVVLVISIEDLAAAGETLRKLNAKTSCLHFLGINILAHDPQDDSSLFRKKFLKAFAWLLPKTRFWYENHCINESSVNPCSINEIQLHNYRLPGKRTLNLSKEHNLYLLHGYNGCGKSSLVEAIEYAYTGKIRRLEKKGIEKENYPKIVVNSESKSAQITIGHSGLQASVQNAGKQKANRGSSTYLFFVDEKKEGQSSSFLDEAMKVGRLRLDQPLMDRIVNCSDAERAAIFVSTFFPGDESRQKTFEEAKEKATKARRELRSAIVAAFLPQGIGEQPARVCSFLAWVKEANSKIKGSRILSIIPVERDLIADLAIFDPALEKLILKTEEELTGKTFVQAINKLEGALRDLRQRISGHLEKIELALSTLKKCAELRGTDKADKSESYSIRLNRWLESHALLETTRQRYLSEFAARKALQDGWSLTSTFESGLVGIPLISERDLPLLASDLKSLTLLEEENRLRIKKDEEQEKEAGETFSAVEGLSEQEVEALNEAGEWIGVNELGDTIFKVIDKGKRRKCRGKDFYVGDNDWADSLIDELTKAEKIGRDFAETEKIGKDVSRIELCEKCLKAHSKQVEAEKAMQETFLRQISKTEANKRDDPEEIPLVDAINEMLTLFTPAGWAYEEINLVNDDEESGEPNVRIAGRDNASLDLRFNTAELNLFTVVLFLLCAVRLKNPLSLLVLDDPLQNMDELTVTSLARGINRVARLLPKSILPEPEEETKGESPGTPWQLLFLFHGEEDLHRFRSEIPAAIYRLPWLTPNENESKESTICYSEEKTRDQFQLSQMHQLLDWKSSSR